jgi:hypothetical protein
MNCPNCKQPLDPSWSFCDSCGFQVNDGQDKDGAMGAASLTTESPGWPGVSSRTGPPGMGPAMATPGASSAAGPPGGGWPGLPSRMGPPGMSAQAPAEMSPGPLDLPGSPILLGYQERILRQYAAVQLRTRQNGEGTLYVTDSRVVFYARAKGRGTQRGSTLMQQTNVADITGMTAYVSRRVSLGLFVLTCVLLVAALTSLLKAPLIGVLLLILVALCIIALVAGAAKRGGTGVIISSRADGHSPIHFGNFDTRRGMIGSLLHTIGGPLLEFFGVFTVFDVLVGFPGENSSQIVNELGALILDLQTRGDLAFQHYGVDLSQRRSGRGRDQ